MLRNPTLIMAAVLAFTMSSAHADKSKSQNDNKEDGIKAEVRGTVHFASGHGYYISVKTAGRAKQEMRVWLYISENKVLVRKLEGLTGKTVIAKGNLAQMPADHQASVPPLGMYMGSFQIEDVGTPWSKNVEGLQCRLRADKAVWKANAVPAFQLEVRDQGKRDLDIHMSQAACKLEFDGAWYDWNGPVSILAGTWAAGRHYDDFEVRVILEAQWARGNKPIALKAGKHTVRVAYVTMDQKQPVRVVSNPVEIQIEGPPSK